MTQALLDQTRMLIGAPLKMPSPAASVGRAALLYLALVVTANSEGLVIRRTEQLAQDLAVPEGAIERWVDRLVEAKLISILSSSPYLTLRLLFWPAATQSLKEIHEETGSRPVPAEPAAAATTKQQQQGVGGPGEGEDDPRMAARVLGETDAAEVRDLIARQPAAIVRKALAAVEATPAYRIRKSRLALFRYLLAKFSETIDVRDL